MSCRRRSESGGGSAHPYRDLAPLGLRPLCPVAGHKPSRCAGERPSTFYAIWGPPGCGKSSSVNAIRDGILSQYQYRPGASGSGERPEGVLLFANIDEFVNLVRGMLHPAVTNAAGETGLADLKVDYWSVRGKFLKDTVDLIAGRMLAASGCLNYAIEMTGRSYDPEWFGEMVASRDRSEMHVTYVDDERKLCERVARRTGQVNADEAAIREQYTLSYAVNMPRAIEDALFDEVVFWDNSGASSVPWFRLVKNESGRYVYHWVRPEPVSRVVVEVAEESPAAAAFRATALAAARIQTDRCYGHTKNGAAACMR